MAYLTPEQIEEWREEAQFQHDRYLRDGTGIGTVLALTQARLLRALTELGSRRDEDGEAWSATARGSDTTMRSDFEPASHLAACRPARGVEAARSSRNPSRVRSHRIPTRVSCRAAGRRRP